MPASQYSRGCTIPQIKESLRAIPSACFWNEELESENYSFLIPLKIPLIPIPVPIPPQYPIEPELRFSGWLRPPEFELRFSIALVDRSILGHCPLVLTCLFLILDGLILHCLTSDCSSFNVSLILDRGLWKNNKIPYLVTDVFKYFFLQKFPINHRGP